MPDTKRTATGVLGGLAGLVGLSAVAGLLVTATVTPAIAVTSNAATTAINIFDNLPSYLDIEELMLPGTLLLKSGDKWVVDTTFYDQNRSPVTFDQVAPIMYDAILSSEDPRFYDHGGIDIIGTARALIKNASSGGETQGGSSISQQYVKNVLVQKCERNATSEDELNSCWLKAVNSDGAEGYQRKLQEMRYAVALEQRYSKNDILLGYLNIANFGGQTYGVDAAARYYFGVPAAKLNLAQAATLAGIVQNPNTYRIDMPDGSITDREGNALNGKADGTVFVPQGFSLAGLDTLLKNGRITQEQYDKAADGYTLTKSRQLYVLSRLLTDGKITQEQYEEAAVAPITPKITAPKTGCSASAAPYFCQYVLSVVANDKAFGDTDEDRQKALRQGGLKIYATLDLKLQKSAQKTMSQYAPTKIDMGRGNRFGSAAVSVDAKSGKILAMVQNTKFSESAALAKKDPAYTSLVYGSDYDHGGSIGFPAGSTFKLFTLVDWLEKGHSVNEVLNGVNRIFPRYTNSCTGDWVNNGRVKVGNFGGVGGYVGTPMRFTRDSLNSGFFAMAEELDLCDIQKDATKMGVQLGDDSGPVTMNTQFSIIGSNNVSPLAMAGAYATIANKGVYCQPRAIEKVTDSEGNDLPVPERTCKQVIDPKVAATAAFALRGVMEGGTGSQGGANPYDGTPLIGKTGTHETWHTWMIESSTRVATAVWVGNSKGQGDLPYTYYKGMALNTLRYSIAREIQRSANKLYKGGQFPEADKELTRVVLKDLPNVVGLSVDDAKKKLADAGFQVTVGESIDSPEAKGIVAKQSPGAGKVAGGSLITINPSNGQGITVPDVGGQTLEDAINGVRAAGFGNVVPGACAEDGSVEGPPVATSTAPGAGKVANRNAQVTVNYKAAHCGGEPGPGALGWHG